MQPYRLSWITVASTLTAEIVFIVPLLRAEPTTQTRGVAELPSGMPGPKGQPPAEITDFVPPIKILDANGYSDGGTIYVHLQDCRGAQLVFCVTQDAFESAITGNSLMIGGSHSDTPSARFPLNLKEAKLVISSLQKAIGEKDKRNAVAYLDDESEWRVRFAQQALRKLTRRADFQLADPAELSARRKRLESVNLADESKRFRDEAGRDREEIWQRLKPVLLGELKVIHKEKRQERLLELLGPSEREAEKRCGDPTPPPTRPTTRLAYTLLGKDRYFHDLVFTFDDQGNFSCAELAIAMPMPADDQSPTLYSESDIEEATSSD